MQCRHKAEPASTWNRLRPPRRERLTPLLGRLDIADIRSKFASQRQRCGLLARIVARWLWQKIGGP